MVIKFCQSKRFITTIMYVISIWGILLPIDVPIPTVEAANNLTFKAVKHVEAAEQFMRHQQWSDANAEWQAALVLYPTDPKVVRGYTSSLMKAKYYQEAVELLQKSIKRSPKEPMFRVLLADIYIFLDEPNRSFSLLRATLREFPEERKALEVLKKLTPHLSGSRKQQAVKMLTLASQNHLTRAKQATRHLDFDKARHYYALATVDSASTESLNDYALACLLTGHYQEARHVFQRLLKQEVVSNDWKVLSNAALASLSAGNTFEARSYIEAAIASLDDDEKLFAELYNNLGYCYEQSNRSLQAQFAYKKSTELAPAYTLAKKNLAYAYLKNMELQQSIATYKVLIRQTPNDSEVWNLIGYAY